jgi:glycosyltransferase involved in cell wall biosynthesis
VISQGLKQEVIDRGIDSAKINIFPNGVDLDHFIPTPVNSCLKHKLGLEGRFVVGYVGSFYFWEGLDLLVRALGEAVKQNPNIRLLFVGADDGDLVKKLVESLQIDEFVRFAGRVEPEKILDYYSVIDLCVYPRKKLRFTDLVTPLKPLEAMAMGKLVLGSDVGGHRELIDDGTTGLLFPAGSQKDLARKIIDVATRPTRFASVREQARSCVLKNRNWNDIDARYQDFYSQLLSVDHATT